MLSIGSQVEHRFALRIEGDNIDFDSLRVVPDQRAELRYLG